MWTAYQMQRKIELICCIRKTLFVFLIGFVSGCQSLPDVNLEPCAQSCDVSVLQFNVPETMRYRYTLSVKGKESFFNGVTRKTRDGEVNIAGFADSGMTAYLAKWNAGKLDLLSNRTTMSASFLKKSVLKDLLLPYNSFENIGCPQYNRCDGSWWFNVSKGEGMPDGYLIVIKDYLAWSWVKNGRMCYFARITHEKNRNLSCIEIENYKDNYVSEVRYFQE